MNTQTQALQLADDLENPTIQSGALRHIVAAELRRLHQSEREGWRYADELQQELKIADELLTKALNQEACIVALKTALERSAAAMELEMKGYADRHERLMPIVHAARAAIAKATGDKA